MVKIRSSASGIQSRPRSRDREGPIELANGVRDQTPIGRQNIRPQPSDSAAVVRLEDAGPKPRAPLHFNCRCLAYPQIFCRHLAAAFLLFVTDLSALVEGTQASPFHRRDVHENILAAAVRLDKSISLSRIEPLHSTYRHVLLPFLNRQNPPGAAGVQYRSA